VNDGGDVDVSRIQLAMYLLVVSVRFDQTHTFFIHAKTYARVLNAPWNVNPSSRRQKKNIPIQKYRLIIKIYIHKYKYV